jgi:4-nitrophenyl phosphatase
MINDLKHIIKDLKIIEELNGIELYIFDLDGIIYRGNKLINHSDIIIKSLKKRGLDVVFNTNNSTVTREMYVDKLAKMKIPVNKDEIYTSAYITAKKLTEIKPKSNIFIIGEIGLKKELELQGHNVVLDDSLSEAIDFIVVGLDRNLTYEKLRIAQSYIINFGGKFYATNTDATLPTQKGILPGAGVMVKAVEIATGQKPLEIFGKPQTIGIDLILESYDTSPDKAAFVGDRLDTDIVAGNRAQLKTILILTGVTTKDMLLNITDEFYTPDIVMKTLREIFTH